jgi:hypothetical protein
MRTSTNSVHLRQMSTTESPVVPGVKRRTGKGHVDSYGDDRICSATDCSTILSRYNGRGVCWRHAPRTPSPHR